MARRTLFERAEAAQEVDLRLAKFGNLNPALGTGQHRQQAQQKYFVEFVDFQLPTFLGTNFHADLDVGETG